MAHKLTPSAIWDSLQLQCLGHLHKVHADNWILISRLDAWVNPPKGMEQLFRCLKEPNCCSGCAGALVHGQLAHLAANSYEGSLVSRGKSLNGRNCLLKNTARERPACLGLSSWGLGLETRNIFGKCSQGAWKQKTSWGTTDKHKKMATYQLRRRVTVWKNKTGLKELETA